MLKYYKEFLSRYEYSSVLQTIILLALIITFVLIFIRVVNRPKNYYENNEIEGLDLESKEKEKNIKK